MYGKEHLIKTKIVGMCNQNRHCFKVDFIGNPNNPLARERPSEPYMESKYQRPIRKLRAEMEEEKQQEKSQEKSQEKKQQKQQLQLQRINKSILRISDSIAVNIEQSI